MVTRGRNKVIGAPSRGAILSVPDGVGGILYMQYEVSFGRLERKPRAVTPGAKFRLALLGDFSGRANAGKLEIGGDLAKRKPIKVDVDNLDTTIERMDLSLTLPFDEDGSAVAVKIAAIDDFHPDQLVENLELFEQLTTLRRSLGNKAGFDRAAKEVLSWGGEEPLPPPPRSARGTAIATDRKLSDFARLVGRSAPADSTADTAVEDLMRRMVGPFIVPARDSRQDQLVARVDEALSAAMRRVLHHPDFQSAEALWRGVEFLVRRIETGARMEIVLYDVSAEELSADLAAQDALDKTGLFGMLSEQPALDAHQGPLSAVVGFYGFEVTPPHAELLARVAQVAGAAGAPFITGIGPDPLLTPMHEQHPLIQDAWQALQELPATAYLGLAAPRFLLRMPYGKKTDPIDAFAFEEFTRQSGLSGMLWGHAALLPALMLAETWARQGAKMQLGAIMTADEMPYYVYSAPDGEQVALPCTERMYSERQAVQVGSYRVMPLLSLRGRPEVRLGGFTSLAGTPLAGFWAPANLTAPAKPSAAAPVPVAAAEPESEAAAEPEGAAEPEAAAEPETAAEAGEPQQAAEPEQASEASADDALSDLDKLLASLNAPAEPVAEDATEPDLDALLASLK
jgi:type VI secretion system protein ImpC